MKKFVVAGVVGGPAAGMMILVNSTDTSAGTWIPYNPYPVVDLGTDGDGLRTVNFYFTNVSGGMTRVSKRLWLDTTPPILTITSPGTNTVDQPVLQLQGFSDKDLCSLSYDLSNAAGLVTNLDVLVLNRSFDISQWGVRTNTFQAFDIGLTPGNNTITLHAMDWAGNWTSETFVYVLDYSSKTAPVVQLYWPTNGALISGTNFTWRGWVDDPTVSVSAQIVDTNGDTNVVNGIVERNGNFWIEDLPLAPGSSWLTLTVADSYTNATNISIGVLQSSVGLSFLCIPDITNQTTVDVEGTISDTSYTVWVNGVQAATNYEGASNYGAPAMCRSMWGGRLSWRPSPFQIRTMAAGASSTLADTGPIPPCKIQETRLRASFVPFTKSSRTNCRPSSFPKSMSPVSRRTSPAMATLYTTA